MPRPRSSGRRSAFSVGFWALSFLAILGAPDILRAESPRPIAPNYTVATSGEYAVVGARWHNGFEGAAYVLKREGDRWIDVQTLAPPDLGRHDQFGSAVTIDGDRIVVGAPWQNLFAGAAYVYRRVGDRWQLEQRLTAQDAAPDARFGQALSVEGNTLTIGGAAGAASYRYQRDGEQWAAKGRVASPRETLAVESTANSEMSTAIDRVRVQHGDPPAFVVAVPPAPEYVVASDGAFEDRVEVTWASVELDAVLYKVTRNGVLLSVVSSEDTSYVDTTGQRGVVYDYCVSVIDMVGPEGPPECDAGSRIVFPARQVAASDGQFIDGVKVTWDDQSTVEEGYYLLRDGVAIDTLASNVQSVTDASAVATVVYSYALIAFDGDGGQSASAADDGFRGVVLPPLEVHATDGEFIDAVELTWIDQIPADNFFIVARTNLTTMVVAVLDTTAVNAQAYTDDTAEHGTRYQYGVTTLDVIGQLSIPVCDDGGVDLPPPTSVAASDSTYDDRIEITWVDPSDLESGFQISRDGTPIDTTNADATLYKDHSADPNVTYTYCVVALHEDGGLSVAACDAGFRSIVLAPTNVQATDGSFEDRVKITWESASTTVVLFNIFRGPSFIKSVPAGSRTYNDTGGTAGVEYDYTVQAVTALLDVSFPVMDQGSRKLRAPRTLAASDEAFEDRVELTWTDASQVESGYVVYREDTSTADVDTLGDTRANMTSFTDRTGAPGTTYRYLVAAFDTKGEARGESDTDDDYGIRTLVAPRSVSATDGEFEDRVEITWADESNAEDGYYIYRNAALIDSTEDNVTSIFDGSPVFGVSSEYRVRAFDAYGESAAASDSGSTVILPPSSFNASDTYDDRIELRWVDVSAAEDGYVLQTDSSNVTLRVDTLGVGATSFTSVVATPNVTYRYRLHAFAGTAVSGTVEDTGLRLVTPVVTAITNVSIKLKAGDADPGDFFGMASSIDGPRAIVGVRYDDDRGTSAGAAYIFSENATGSWSQEAQVYNAGAAANQGFGAAVAITGDRVLIGAPGETSFRGSATFMVRDANGAWVSEGKKLASNGLASDQFGYAVALEGDRAIVGAPFTDSIVSNSGTAYIFQRTGGTWNERAAFKSGDPGNFDSFGSSVAISGNRVVVGAPADDNLVPNAGAAYVFTLNTDASGNITGVTQQAKLTAEADALDGVGFGASVGISGDLVVVGIEEDLENCIGRDPQAAYVFAFDEGSGTWSREARLTATDGVECDLFGDPVAISGQRILVGTGGGVFQLPSPPYSLSEGGAYIFDRDADGTWSEKGKLLASDGAQIGGGVAISGDRLMVGAPLATGESSNEGSAYILYLVVSPGDVAASDGTVEGFVHVQWVDRSSNEEAFVIYRDGVEYATVGSDVEFYDDVNAEPGRTYEYAVSANNTTSGFESERVADFGWRPPDGNITGHIASRTGVGVPNVDVCLEPPPTRALLFDGVGGHVVIPDDGTFNFGASDEFTLEAWFSYSGSDRSPRLISKLAKSGTDQRPLDLGLQRNGRLFFAISDGTNVARVLSQRNDFNDDEWHHVACVNDAGSQQLILYIDGVEESRVGTGALGAIGNESDIFVGGFEDGTWFGGQLDELRVWNVARTAAELQAAATTPLAGDEGGLVGYWDFDAFSGVSVTDYAGVAQYGVLVGGVYRTDKVAPLDLCGKTDADGAFVLTNVRYAENGTDFKLRPSLGDRQFSPAVQPITLNRGHPVENQVLFSDISSHTVAGRVQFAASNCFQADVEILVDGAPSGAADKNGKFAVTVDQGTHTIKARLRDYQYWVAFEGDTTHADSLTIDVVDDVDLLFLNKTTHTVSGKVGGGCDHYVGEVTIRFRSESNCFDTTLVGNPAYTLELPPLKYFASASVDPATIPDGLHRPDVVEFFENLGEREIDMSAVADTTLDFIYRAPLRVAITGFEDYVDPNCRLELEDGTLLPPGLPVLPQLESVNLVIRVEEVYGNTVCPLDTGMVVITDEIFDKQDEPDTLTVSGGEAKYTTFASTPSLVRGRTEGGNDRSFQKALTARVQVEGRAPVTETEWVLVTGHVAPEGAQFVTVPTTEFPLFMLRDPPGDGSYAYLEEQTSSCVRVDWTNFTLSGGLGGGFEIKAGATTKAFVGLGAGIITAIKANGVVKGKLMVGVKYSSETAMDLCFTTKDRFSTSATNDFVGEEGDLYVGAGISFLFSEVGVIKVNGCVVEQSTSVGFEPDSIQTTFSFTERHIKDVLIPELDSKAAYYEAQGDQDSTAVFEIMRDQWQAQLDENRRLKNEAVLIENRSFSAGANFEYTHTEDTTRTWTNKTVGFLKADAEGGFEWGHECMAHFYLYLAETSF
jgi:fibronectin type 3 domain-containing protein